MTVIAIVVNLAILANGCGIEIPEGCAPVYKSKQAREKKPGRPKMQKEVKLTFIIFPQEIVPVCQPP